MGNIIQTIPFVKAMPKSSLKIKKTIIPWLFVLPGLTFTIWLRYYPMLKGIYISLLNYNVVTPPGKFVGFDNYASIFTQQFYWDAWKNTLAFLMLSLIFGFIPPIIQALLLSEIGRGRKLFSTLYLIPALIPVSITVILWKWVWNPDYGIANEILKLFGVSPQLWLNSIEQVKFAIMFPTIVGSGVTILIYLAAILGVSNEIMEAAVIDGCGGIKRLIFIILPNIKFIISIQLVMIAISSLQLMDGPFQYTGGGPALAANTMGLFIYNTFYSDMSFGKANAASVILFAVIAILTILQLRINKSEIQ